MDAIELTNKAQFAAANPMPLYRLSSFPAVLASNQFRQLKEACIGISRLIQKIVALFFNDDLKKFDEYYQFGDNSYLLKLVYNEHSIKNILFRPDFILTADGWRCLEVNAGNAGGWVVSLLSFLYQSSVDQITNVVNTPEVLFKHLIQQTLQDCHSISDAEINLAIIVGEQSSDEFNSFCLAECRKLFQNALLEIAATYTGSVFFCDYSELEFQQNSIKYKGNAIHIIYEEQITSHSNRMRALSFATKKYVHLNPGPITRFLNDKRHLALLSENQNHPQLSPFEHQLIQAYIPWTRLFLPQKTEYQGRQIDLPQFVQENRRNMVLKKGFSNGGTNVFLGMMHSETEWQQCIETALQEGDWVVQEYIKSIAYSDATMANTNFDVIWGAFVLKENYAGGFARILAQTDYRRSENSDSNNICSSLNSDRYALISPIFSLEQNTGIYRR